MDNLMERAREILSMLADYPASAVKLNRHADIEYLARQLLSHGKEERRKAVEECINTAHRFPQSAKIEQALRKLMEDENGNSTV